MLTCSIRMSKSDIIMFTCWLMVDVDIDMSHVDINKSNVDKDKSHVDIDKSLAKYNKSHI